MVLSVNLGNIYKSHLVNFCFCICNQLHLAYYPENKIFLLVFLLLLEFSKHSIQKAQPSSLYVYLGRALLSTGSAILLSPQWPLTKSSTEVGTCTLRLQHRGPDFAPWARGLQELLALAVSLAKSNPLSWDSGTLISSLVLQAWDGPLPCFQTSVEATTVHINVSSCKSQGRRN